jgi:CBS domain-containing protein
MLRKIQDVMKDAELAELPPAATVQVAARLMTAVKQCAVLVISGGDLVGIVTEQDIVRRVVAAGNDPALTTLFQVMTAHPDTIGPNELAITGLRMMEDGGYRHLPVVSRGRILGLISRVDYVGEEKTEIETERHYWEAIG